MGETMKIIGITGSSGSGKTTICEILRQKKDIKIINVDQIAKNLTNSQTDYFLEIKQAFQQDDILLENDSLNRKKLAELIYHDDSKRQKLNCITFKHLVPAIMQQTNDLPDDIKIVIIDAPLLFEAGLEKYCDFTIAMQAPIELKINRICKRDHILEEVAKARLEIQQTNEFYRKNADCVIENDENTTIEMLTQRMNQILNKFYF